MTDRDLADLVTTVTTLEARVGAYLVQAAPPLPEADQALVARRHLIAARKTLERWITVRQVAHHRLTPV